MTIQKNLFEIHQKITHAAHKAGRHPEEITLVAVSKFQPIEAIEEAYHAGQRLFGENYAQELRDKARDLSHLLDLRFHFIGRLQKNKVKYVAAAAECMESLDDLDIAAELNQRSFALGRILGTLIEINFDESQKGGISLDMLPRFIEALGTFDSLRIDGLMTLPPMGISENESRALFRTLSRAAQKFHLKHLSMGMSDDYELAIEEGATIVRIGTAIFGPRERSVSVE